MALQGLDKGGGAVCDHRNQTGERIEPRRWFSHAPNPTLIDKPDGDDSLKI